MEINNSHKNTKNNFVLGCTNIHKSFGGLIALDNVSFAISKGIIIGLVGPNGAGKTTLFDVISGVTNLNSGKILFNDKDISNLSKRTVFKLFQENILFRNSKNISNSNCI